MQNYSREKEVAKRIALAAGQIILDCYSKNVAVDMKAGNEPVTEADHLASDFIIEQLKKDFPEDIVISEETSDNPARFSAKRFWIIDPLDGTKEFIARNGEFSVMIGLVEDGKAVVGAVFQPTENRLWWGDRNQSFLLHNNVETQLKVSDKDDFREMAAVISRSHRSAILDEIFKFIGLTNEITSGSSGIKLGLISEAKAELMLSASAGYKIWDICAPEAILVGAGGKVTDFTGAAISYQSEEQRVRNGILASNGHKHDELADILQKMVKLPFAKP